MPSLIVSDLHLGNVHCRGDDFLAFLDTLDAGAELILNGDTIDRWQTELPENHRIALDRIRDESRRRRVVWVRGNHDETYAMPDSAAIEFRSSYNLGKQLFITHGHDFDNVMPYNKLFLWTFRLLHKLRIWLGAESVHVAHYAKRFPTLYQVLRHNVAMNAVEHAKENGYAAATCGHTHHPEDMEIDGIRYLNTGSWTEEPPHYIAVDENGIELRQFRNGTG